MPQQKDLLATNTTVIVQRWHTGNKCVVRDGNQREHARGRAKRPLKIPGVNVHAGGELEDTTVVAAAHALLDSTFEGDVVLKAARITLDSTAVIRGNFSFSAASIEGLDRETIERSVSELPFETPEAKKRRHHSS